MRCVLSEFIFANQPRLQWAALLLRLRARVENWNPDWVADVLIRLLPESDQVLRPLLVSYLGSAVSTDGLLAYHTVEKALSKWLSRHEEYNLQRWAEALPAWSGVGRLLANHAPSPAESTPALDQAEDWPVSDLVTAFRSINLLFSLLTSMRPPTPEMPSLVYVLVHILGHQLLPRVDRMVPANWASSSTESSSAQAEEMVTLLHTQLAQSVSLLVSLVNAFSAPSLPFLEQELAQTSLAANNLLSRLSSVWSKRVPPVPEVGQNVIADSNLESLVATDPHSQISLAIPALLQGLISHEYTVALQTIHSDTAIVIASLSHPGLAWNDKARLVQALACSRYADVSRKKSDRTDLHSDVLNTFAFELLHAATVYAHAVLPHPGGAVISVSMLCAVLPALLALIPPALGSRPDEDLRCDLALRASLILDAELFRSIESYGFVHGGEAGATSESMGFNLGDNHHPVRMLLLRSLEEHQLITADLVRDVPSSDAGLSLDYSEVMSNSLAYEGEQQDLPLATLIEQRVSSEAPQELLGKLITDHGSARSVVAAISAHITASLIGRDVEGAAAWCSALIHPYPESEGKSVSPSHLALNGSNGVNGNATTGEPNTASGLAAKTKAGTSMPLDAVLLFCTPEQLIRPICTWLANDSTPEYAGEEARAVGALIVFVQFVCSVYSSHLSGTASPGSPLSLTSSSAVSVVLRSARPSTAASSNTAAAHPDGLISRWVTALFGSEGISDDLLQDSPPHVLVQLTPILFDQCVRAAQMGLLDSDSLRSGLTYFLEEPLRYTLPSAIFWLVRQIWTTPVFLPSQNAVEPASNSGHTSTPTSNDAGASYQQALAMAPAGWVHATAHRRAVLSDILVMLLCSEKCPPSVRAIVAVDVLALPAGALLPAREEEGQEQTQFREDKASSIQHFRALLKNAHAALHRGPGSDGLSLLLRESQRPAWLHAHVLLPMCTALSSSAIATLLCSVPSPSQDLSPYTAALATIVLFRPSSLIPGLSQALTESTETVSIAATVLAALVKIGACGSFRLQGITLPSPGQASQVALLLASRIAQSRQNPLDISPSLRKALAILATAASERNPLPASASTSQMSPETHGWVAIKDVLQMDHVSFISP